MSFATRARSRGFTLIELIFVMVLMGILGGFVVPKMSAITGMNRKTEVLKLAGFLQRAHQLAVLRGKNFRVVLDMDARKFWIEEQVPPPTQELLPDEFKVDDILLAFRKEAEDYMDEENIEKRKQARFRPYKAKGIKTATLSPPLSIESVYLSTLPEKITEGLIYIPISHAGYHPTTIIYVADKDGIAFSLVFPSLSAQASVDKGETKPEDIQW